VLFWLLHKPNGLKYNVLKKNYIAVILLLKIYV